MKTLVPSSRGAVQWISIDQLAGIPEEEIWLASRKSAPLWPHISQAGALYHAQPALLASGVV